MNFRYFVAFVDLDLTVCREQLSCQWGPFDVWREQQYEKHGWRQRKKVWNNRKAKERTELSCVAAVIVLAIHRDTCIQAYMLTDRDSDRFVCMHENTTSGLFQNFLRHVNSECIVNLSMWCEWRLTPLTHLRTYIHAHTVGKDFIHKPFSRRVEQVAAAAWIGECMHIYEYVTRTWAVCSSVLSTFFCFFFFFHKLFGLLFVGFPISMLTLLPSIVYVLLFGFCLIACSKFEVFFSFTSSHGSQKTKNLRENYTILMGCPENY